MIGGGGLGGLGNLGAWRLFLLLCKEPLAFGIPPFAPADVHFELNVEWTEDGVAMTAGEEERDFVEAVPS